MFDVGFYAQGLRIFHVALARGDHAYDGEG
jgi:hypothetical protein